MNYERGYYLVRNRLGNYTIVRCLGNNREFYFSTFGSVCPRGLEDFEVDFNVITKLDIKGLVQDAALRQKRSAKMQVTEPEPGMTLNRLSIAERRACSADARKHGVAVASVTWGVSESTVRRILQETTRKPKSAVTRTQPPAGKLKVKKNAHT